MVWSVKDMESGVPGICFVGFSLEYALGTKKEPL